LGGIPEREAQRSVLVESRQLGTMANFGQRPINNANDYKKQTSSVIYHAGEQRIDRRPYGKCERFVDPVGNVITLQLATPGDPAAMQTAMKLRAEKHIDGWIEHAKCPLRHGHDNLTPAITREFSKMPKSYVAVDIDDDGKETKRTVEVPASRCDQDPKVMARRDGELHADFACPHIEWLIHDRRKREAEQNAKRNKARVAEENRKEEAKALQTAQLEMVKEQIEERKARKRGEKKAPTE
jgi:hypothetical protein